MALVKFGNVVNDVKVNVDRNNNPYEYYIAGDHMNSEDLTLRRKGKFATDDVGPAFIRIFKPGQVLYGSRRTYLKKVAVADFEGITANTTFVLETKNKKVLSQQLLPFIMLTEGFTNWSIKKSKGSTNPYILFSDLAEYEFDLPPIEEQERLAKLLWAAYELKESYKKLIIATDEMVQAQFIKMFGCLNSPHGIIEDIIKKNIIKASVSFDKNDDIKYIDISSIDNNIKAITSTTLYKMKDAPSRAQQCVKKGDILVSTVRPNLKNIAVVQFNDTNLVASSGYCVLRPIDKYKDFLMTIVLSEQFTVAMSDIAEGSNYPAVHDYDILRYSIPIPEDNCLSIFSGIFQQAGKLKAELQKSIEKIENVMKSLLP